LQLTLNYNGTMVPLPAATGSTFVVAQDASPLGAGWTLSTVDQLVNIPADAYGPAGKLRVYGSGGYRFYSGSSSPYTSPANDAGTLTYDGFGNILSQTGAAYRGVYGFTGRPTDGPAPRGATSAS